MSVIGVFITTFLTIFVIVGVTVAAAVPKESPIRAPDAMMGKRRTPFTALLSAIGSVVPMAGRRAVALRDTLAYTGFRVTVWEFQGLKVLLALLLFMATFTVLKDFLHDTVMLYSVIGAVAGFFIPDLWLRARVQETKRAIVKLLPEVIDLLGLSIGAGLDFLMALTKVVAIKRYRKEPLVAELGIALQEIKLGKRRSEALKSLARRVNLTELSSFVRTMVQADRMGTPMAQVLAIHSEDVRLQRLMRAERAALKAPLKILVPLIFFIMPCVAIIVAAPVFLEFMHSNPFTKP